MFMKEGRSLFLFFQGHPEYDPGALLHEYRRDVRRFLAGTTDVYPRMPQGLLDDGGIAALSALRQRALRERHRDVLAEITSVISTVTPAHVWREAAIGIYSNWLSYLADRKRRGAPASFAAGLREPYHAPQSRQMDQALVRVIEGSTPSVSDALAR